MPQSTEQVIELSVEETNKLRAKLGLAPLRGVHPSQAGKFGNDEGNMSGSRSAAYHGSFSDQSAAKEETVLELSVSETNALRQKLGLAPLRDGHDANGTDSKEEHAPAPNQGEIRALAERIERSKLKRQVEQGVEKRFNEVSLASDSVDDGETGNSSLLSWAKQLRQNQPNKSKATTQNSKSHETTESGERYSDSDLKGLNVNHSVKDIQGAGESVILTLADTEILDVHDASRKVLGLNEDESALENVNLAEEQKQRDGLREKRQLELGMGRAGGYAGFDDDEFLELGGSQAPSRTGRDERRKNEPSNEPSNSKRRRAKRGVGFQIGDILDEQDKLAESDLFASESGKAISLQYGSTSLPQESTMSDFMTAEEDEERKLKNSKKSSKFKKKKKSKKDKERTKHRRRKSDDDGWLDPSPIPSGVPDEPRSLLADLEESAKTQGNIDLPRKRRLDDDGDELNQKEKVSGEDNERTKAQRYASIMEKGNERTRQAFSKESQRNVAPKLSIDEDDEPDDAFLNAALAKARRLNRLKELAAKKEQSQPRLGEDAVLEVVQSLPVVTSGDGKDEKKGGNLVFSIDETREFTRALRARQEQTDRNTNRAKTTQSVKVEQDKTASPSKDEVDSEPRVKMEEENDGDDEQNIDVKMEELAEQVQDDDEKNEMGTGLEGATGSSVAIGRGLGGVLNILKQTGEITKKNAGREEQRGRAKDERTYEDYEPMDLSKVIQLDENNATEKDKELSKREIKLEYRDKYGRLLTRKEAFRDLSYQFHGYGSGKRKQEKKLQQIHREQAEQRLSSRQASSDGGTLGALKATQKATGKAFIVHKTS